jgi:hypothetical protein
MTIKLNENEILDIKKEIYYMQLKEPEHNEIHEKK